MNIVRPVHVGRGASGWRSIMDATGRTLHPSEIAEALDAQATDEESLAMELELAYYTAVKITDLPAMSENDRERARWLAVAREAQVRVGPASGDQAEYARDR